MLMTLPYIMVPRDELQSMLREAEEKAEEMERIRVHEKVDTWMQQITPDVHDSMTCTIISAVFHLLQSSFKVG